MRRKRTILRDLDRLKKRCARAGGRIIIKTRLLGRPLDGRIVVACVKDKDVVFARELRYKENKNMVSKDKEGCGGKNG